MRNLFREYEDKFGEITFTTFGLPVTSDEFDALLLNAIETNQPINPVSAFGYDPDDLPEGAIA